MVISSDIKSQKIIEHLNHLSEEKGSLDRVNMWQLKRELSDKTHEPPCAKYDLNGELLTDTHDILSLYEETYKLRLRKRTILPEYKFMERLKTSLFDLRLELAKNRKSEEWSENQLIKVLKSLKGRKCPDPLGLIYDLFKPGVIGKDLFSSLLMFCNQTKEKLEIIDQIKKAQISSIYKKKGSRLSIESERGIFSVVKIRSIIEKLILQDYYDKIDSNMSDSNVGARKERNIRDNLFVLYSVLADVSDCKHH